MMKLLLLQLLLMTAGSWGQLQLVVDSSSLLQLPSLSTHSVQLSLQHDRTLTAPIQLVLTADVPWMVDLQPSVLNLSGSADVIISEFSESFPSDTSSSTSSRSTHVNITGLFLGHVKIHVQARDLLTQQEVPLVLSDITNPSNSTSSPAILHASIVRESGVKNMAFYSLVGLLLLFLNFNMGIQLDMESVKKVFKTPVGPLTGFLSQFVLMPLIAYTLAHYAFPDQPLFQLGLFTLGVCPGGGFSNFWTVMFDGDVCLSVAMTFFSTFSALGMMPLWMYTLGRTFFISGHRIQIPFSGIVTSLVMISVPSALGMLIHWKKPEWKQYSDKTIKPMLFVFLLFLVTVTGNLFWNLIVVGIWLNWEQMQLLAGRQLAVGFGVVALGFLLGALLATIFRRPLKQIATISIETSVQNVGLALVMLKLSLPAPDGDLAGLAAIGQMVASGTTLWLGFFIYKIAGFIMDKIKQRHDQRAPSHPAAESPRHIRPNSSTKPSTPPCNPDSIEL